MLALLALVFAAAAPPAERPAARTPAARVALLSLRALGVPEDVQGALQATLANELATLPEASLVPAATLAQALRAEPGCEAALPCATAAAAKTGASLLVMGTASQLGDAFLIDLKLVDTRTAKELRRATHPLTGSQDGLIEVLRAAAVELLAPARYSGALRIEVAGAPGAEVFVDGKPVGRAPLSEPVRALVPGQHTVRVSGARDVSQFAEVQFGRTAAVQIDPSAPAPIEGSAQGLPRAPAPGSPPPAASAGPGAASASARSSAPGAATGTIAAPAAALGPGESVSPRAPSRPAWLRPAALAGLGAGVGAVVIGIAFHARAYATASDLNRREAHNQLGPSDLAAYGRVDTDVKRARAFYLAGAALGAVSGTLLYFSF